MVGRYLPINRLKLDTPKLNTLINTEIHLGSLVDSFLYRGKKVTLALEDMALRVMTVSSNRVEKAITAPLEPGLVVEGIIHDPQRLGTILDDLFQAEDISRSNVVTCIGGGHTIYKTFDLPSMNKGDLEGAVLYQAKREMLIPLEEMVVVWDLAGTRNGRTEVFVAGVPKEVTSTYAETFTHAKIKPRSIDLKPLALCRAVNRPTAIIGNAEASSVEVVYLLDETPMIIRTVYYPDIALSPLEVARRLASEVQLTIRLYNDSNRFAPVSPSTPVLLSGGAYDYFSLAEAMYGELEFSLERLAPAVECPLEISVEEFAVNIGLALKGKKR